MRPPQFRMERSLGIDNDGPVRAFSAGTSEAKRGCPTNDSIVAGSPAGRVVYTHLVLAGRRRRGGLHRRSQERRPRTTGGTLLWRYEAGDDVRSSPAVVDRVVYIGSSDGTVHTLTDSIELPYPSSVHSVFHRECPLSRIPLGSLSSPDDVPLTVRLVAKQLPGEFRVLGVS